MNVEGNFELTIYNRRQLEELAKFVRLDAVSLRSDRKRTECSAPTSDGRKWATAVLPYHRPGVEYYGLAYGAPGETTRGYRTIRATNVLANREVVVVLRHLELNVRIGMPELREA